MPSKSQTDEAEHSEISLMDRNARATTSLPPHQAQGSSNEKASSLRERKPSKPKKPVDDVVKYMSSVPSYLQRVEQGGSVLGKALNFGVLDWDRLENWRYHQKQSKVTRVRGSPSSTNSSSSASSTTFASSSTSTTNTTDGSFSLRKQSPALNTKGTSIEKPQPRDKAKSRIFHQNFSSELEYSEDWLQDKCSVVEGMWDHLQENKQERRISCDSINASRKRISGKNIPYSCPLPSMSQSDEPLEDKHLKLGQFIDILPEKSSKGKEMKQHICSDNSREENAASSDRSRRSPLRRMFDTLNRPRNPRTQESSHEDNLPIRVELKSEDEPCKQEISTRKALLKLVWKNGLPLFVLFSDDNNILAATMGKGSTYTMFIARELKKKGGFLVNKSKKHDVAYDVVGQMKISSSPDMREFVLFGRELSPTTHLCVSSPLNSELAAIIIQIPNQLQKQSLSIVAILPNGVHGIALKGDPSPLIERWRSGGCCDCGGWDEGCMLTVLTNNVQESRSSSSSSSSSSSQACSEVGAHRIELFPPGENREKKRFFRMTMFKEGTYTVEFGTSVALTQVFAMCIAILHNTKPHTLSGLHYSMKAENVRERTFTEKIEGGAPTSYVPNHPPLSPVRRA